MSYWLLRGWYVRHDPNWSIIGNRSALSRGNRWVLPCVPLERGSSERGQAELPLSILFSSDGDRVCRTERGRLRQAHRPTRSSSEVLALVRALRVSRWTNVKARRLRGPGYRSETQAPFSQFYLGARIRDWRVSLESLWAWIVIISTIHALRLFLTGGFVSWLDRPSTH